MFKFVLTLCLVLIPSLSFAEKIHYKVSKMGLSGKASVNFVGNTTYKDKETFLIEFQAEGFNFRDFEKIYLDPKTYKPLYVERDIDIFGKKEKIFEDYLTEGEIKITKTVNGKTEEQVLKKKGDVDNIYGFIYRYRQEGNFKIGDVVDVNLPTKNFKIKLTKMRRLSYHGKTFDCYYMESDPPEYKIWFESSKMKIPVRIAGKGNMVMTDYEK